MTSVPRMIDTSVTIGLLNSTPKNSAWPAVADVGTKNLPRLVEPWKYSTLVVLARRTFSKMAPKPRDAADTTVVVWALGTTNLKSMPLSLNMAKGLWGLNDGKRPVTLALTSVKLPPAWLSVLTA